MPKELIRGRGRDDFADLLIQWGRDELGDGNGYTQPQEPRIRVFVAGAMPLNHIVMQPDEGSSMWQPEHPSATVGPVDLHLDREQCNRLIRVLRRARDQAYGRDE